MSRAPKLGIAVGLSVVSLLLFFAVGEGMESATTPNSSQWIQVTIMAVAMGLYFLVAQYFLSRGNARAVRTDSSLILCLNSILILAALIALIIEPNKGAALQAAGVAALGVVCSYAGAAIAARGARRRAA